MCEFISLSVIKMSFRKSSFMGISGHPAIRERKAALSAVCAATLLACGSAQASGFTCTNGSGAGCWESGSQILAEAPLANAADKTITISGELQNKDLIAAAVNASGNATGNRVVLDGAAISWQDASGQSALNLGDTAIRHRLAGVLQQDSGSGNTSGNSVIIRNGSNISHYEIYGAYVSHEKNQARVTGNSVEISDSRVQLLNTDPNAAAPGIYGAFSTDNQAELEGNSVTIRNAAITASGREIITGGEGYADAKGNRLEIADSRLDGVAGLSGGHSSWLGKNALNNSVLISSTNLTGDDDIYIYGGIATENGSKASSNSVTLNGVTAQNGIVYGGLGRGAASDNHVRLVGAASILKSIAVGYSAGEMQGNRLDVAVAGNKTGSLGSVQSINFYVPGYSTESMLTLTDANAGNLSGVERIRTSLKAGGSFHAGDRINLITCEACSLTLSSNLVKEKGGDYAESADHVMTEGVSLAWNFDYGQDEKNLYITIGSSTDPDPKPTPTPTPTPDPDPGAGDNPKPSEPTQLRRQTKSLVETQLATATLIRQGSDLLARSGLEAMENAIATPRETVQAYTPFVAVSGSDLRHQTSSHVDVKGGEAVVGVVTETANSLGRLYVAPLVEYGRGHYDSYIDHNIHGKGTASYYGAGVALRQTFGQGFYADASARMGRVDSDYSSSDLDGASSVKYDLGTTYAALHATLGKAFAIDDKRTATLYAKYFYDWQKSANATLSSGEAYRFASVDGHRVQAGGKYSYGLSKLSSLYVDMLYQYEFQTEARATYTGLSTPLASMKGSSGSLGLGWHKEAEKGSPWFADLQAIGWTGKQRRVAAHIIAGYKF